MNFALFFFLALFKFIFFCMKEYYMYEWLSDSNLLLVNDGDKLNRVGWKFWDVIIRITTAYANLELHHRKFYQ